MKLHRTTITDMMMAEPRKYRVDYLAPEERQWLHFSYSDANLRTITKIIKKMRTGKDQHKSWKRTSFAIIDVPTGDCVYITCPHIPIYIDI